MSIHAIQRIEIRCDKCTRVLQVCPPTQSFTGGATAICEWCQVELGWRQTVTS